MHIIKSNIMFIKYPISMIEIKFYVSISLKYQLLKQLHCFLLKSINFISYSYLPFTKNAFISHNLASLHLNWFSFIFIIKFRNKIKQNYILKRPLNYNACLKKSNHEYLMIYMETWLFLTTRDLAEALWIFYSVQVIFNYY